jgi:hypothetical protein
VANHPGEKTMGKYEFKVDANEDAPDVVPAVG